LFGRGVEADIKVEHESCSKKHAQLVFANNQWHLKDLQSTNGTKKNNQPISPNQDVTLSRGDVIKFAFSSRDYILK